MDTKVCQSWQGFLQLVVLLVSQGYWHYCQSNFPKHKKEKWDAIDAKLCQRYPSLLSKWQRLRRKKKGLANFYYFRWNSLSMIMRTDGQCDVALEDNFKDIRKCPIVVTISELTSFKIQPEEGVKKTSISVSLDRSTYQGIKSALHEVIKTKDRKKIWFEFNKINGFPSYRNIIRQKQQLAVYSAKQAKQNQIQINPGFFRINTYLKRYPIFHKTDLAE